MRKRALIVILAMCIALFSGCARPAATPSGANEAHRAEPDHGSCLTLTCDDPDNIDPQCTTEHYMVALNAFDRLVEVQTNADRSTEIAPSLADAWEVC